MSCLPNVGKDALLLYLHNKTAFRTQNANNTEMLMCATPQTEWHHQCDVYSKWADKAFSCASVRHALTIM